MQIIFDCISNETRCFDLLSFFLVLQLSNKIDVSTTDLLCPLLVTRYLPLVTRYSWVVQ